MEATVLNASIAAGAAIIGATIAGFASLFNTRHKLKELELAASQKLRGHYLQNAREYTRAIYVPLTLAVSRLYDAYAAFRALPERSVDPLATFQVEIDKFGAEIKRLRDSGAEAFLTNELEDRLRLFAEFLAESRDATTLTRRAELGFKVGFGGLTWSETGPVPLFGWAAIWLRSPRLSVGIPGVGLTYEATVVLSAPLNAPEFNSRFVADTGELRYLIKEVTLGGKPRESPAN